MNNKNVKLVIYIVSIMVIFTIVFIVLNNLLKNKEKGYDEYLKNYKVNEYIPTYVSDEDMAKIYLKDYIHNMFYDIEAAYDSLDTEYKNKKFGSLDNYKKYVYSLDNTSYVVSSYYKKDKNGYIYFGVYDTFGNTYVFKTKGVMQYSVFLDEETVEIW